MQFVVRRGTQDDFEGLKSLISQWNMEWEINDESISKAIDCYLSDSSKIFLVAEDENNIVGYITGSINPTFYLNGNISWIEELLVKNSETNSGIGSSLIKDFESICIQNNVKMIHVASTSKSPFYEKSGFDKKGTYLVKQIAKF